jgi:BUD22
MSKRKRGDEEGRLTPPYDDGPTVGGLRLTLIKGTTDLSSALKLARGFERQKLGRRQKQASTEPKTLLRLREEVIVLKELDCETTARNYLIKHLSKAKRVRESSGFQLLYGSGLKIETAKSNVALNVVGRLIKSGPAKTAISRFMDDVYTVLDLPSGPASGNINLKLPASKANGEDKAGSEAILDVNVDQALDAETKSPPEDAVTPEGTDAIQDDDEESVSSQSDPEITSKAKARRVAPASTSTSFLPTLNAGYISGSESEIDDNAIPEHRKNRRGQQARRQIAELKYGRNAKHIQQQGRYGGNVTWDAQKGAVDRSKSKHGRGVYNRNSGRKDKAGGEVETSSKEIPKKRDDTGSLHPSWEAAKMRKLQPISEQKFSGKKTTFD